MSNEEFDNLKEELMWEGSSVVMLSSAELKFLEASMAYLSGKPIMSDEEYDKLKMLLKFNGQEPGSNEEIQEFACTRFKEEYLIFSKVDVNGKEADPLYKFLKSSKGGFLGDNIKWNFTKFLIDREGKVVERYAPTTSPLSIKKDIKKLL